MAKSRPPNGQIVTSVCGVELHSRLLSVNITAEAAVRLFAMTALQGGWPFPNLVLLKKCAPVKAAT